MAITFAKNINATQQQGINDLVASGRTFNETDAKNYAYATGAGDYNQFLGKTGSQIAVPSSVNASALTTGSTFQPLAAPTPAVNPSDFVNRINAGIGAADKIYQESLKQSQTQLEPFQKEQTNLVERIKSLVGGRTNTTDFYNQQLQTAGVPEAQKNLNDLNIQIANRTADFNTNIAKIPGQGIGLTNNAVAGLTDRERRLASVELGNLATLKLAYQENINAATQSARDLVEFKYQDEENAIKDQLQLLEINYNQMSDAQKKVAEEQAVLLTDRQARIDEAKAESTAIANAAIEAARLGAPSNVAQQMQQATSLQEALQIGGQYLGAEFEAQQDQQKFENDLASGKVSSSSRSSGGDVVWETTENGVNWSESTTPETTTPRLQITWEEYLKEAESKAYQSFSQEKRDALRKQYDAMSATPTAQAKVANLEKYDFRVQQVINGQATAESLFTGGTQAAKDKYSKQLEQAQKEGLLKPAPTEKQIAKFNSIVDKYNKSPLIAASDRTVVLKNAIQNVKANPESGTAQLNLSYAYIQALDTYQSAVREGELGIVNSIDSTIGKWKNNVEQMKNGQIVRPDVATKIAEAAQSLVDTISEGARAKEKSFASQAKVNGVQDLWGDFQGGYESSFEQPSNTGINGQTTGGVKFIIEQ